MVSEKYGIITYHVGTNLGDKDTISQFINPVFILVTILLITFTSFMLALCTLLSFSHLNPHCNKWGKSIKKCNCGCNSCRNLCCKKQRKASLHSQYTGRSNTGRSTPFSTSTKSDRNSPWPASP
eukprot:UN11535